MSYLVLARKYRPQSFGEMAGQEHVVRTLSNSLKSGQLAHAFLFTGPRGVGKTTSARLVAKCLNCVKGPTAEPCGTCTPCLEIAEGRAVDVIEIDAASNNGVDNVRDIVEAVKYRPARDRFKVFVVDEVHMLSMGAFNALLKTLEEPPEHVKFVLATTDVHKVPETIVSRCQRFDFRRLTQQQIVEQLRKVAQAEGLTISDGALALVARTAEGGMRDALSMLDQVRAACGDAADDGAVAEAVGAVDAGAVARLGRGLVARDGAAVLREVEGLHARGQEMKRVAEELVRHLRDVVVAKLVPGTPLDLPDTERREVEAQAEAGSAPQLTRLFDLVQRATAELKFSEQPRYALEVALLKCCFLAPGAEVQELVARLEGLAGGGPDSGSGRSGSPGGGARGGKAAAPQPQRAGAPARPAPEPVEREGPPARRSSPAAGEVEAGDAPARAPTQPSTTAAPAAPADLWRELVAEVERSSPRLGTSLKQGVLLSLGDGKVALRVPPGMALSTLERGRAEIEAILGRRLGGPVVLALAAGAAGADGDPVEAQRGMGQSLAAVEQAEREGRSARLRAAAQAHPNIREAAEILNGEVTKIEEL